MTHAARQLRQIKDFVGEREGWDSSRLRAEKAPVPWSYPDGARRFISQTDCEPDLGTTGSERLLALVPGFRPLPLKMLEPQS